MRLLWPYVPLLRVSCGRGGRGAGYGDGVGTGAVVELQRGGNGHTLYMSCSR